MVLEPGDSSIVVFTPLQFDDVRLRRIFRQQRFFAACSSNVTCIQLVAEVSQIHCAFALHMRWRAI